MRDIEADWKRWSRGEKMTAILLLALPTLTAPALLLLAV
jgi:hypothetical protein